HPMNCGINVPGIVERDEPEPSGGEWRAELEGVEKQGVAAQRESRLGVARARLIDGKSAMGLAAAHKEALGQRDQRGRPRLSVGGFNGETRVAGEEEMRPEAVIGCVLRRDSQEICLEASNV